MIDGILDDFKKMMDTPEFQECMKEWLQEYSDKIKSRRQKVSSKEYIDWLYDYVSTHGHSDDESALYIYKGIDSENGQLLSSFINYIKDLASQQKVPIISDDECMFGNEQVIVKIKDKYFDVFRMDGQGSWSSVVLLEKEPDGAYVTLVNNQ